MISSFANQGQDMVDALLGVTPAFHTQFNQIFEPGLQIKIASERFKILSEEWKKQRDDLKEISHAVDEIEPKRSKKYFEQRRLFSTLVPSFYKRTDAPRISTAGSTFHGMKKNLLISILKELSLNRQVAFLDVDMSAAHTRIARYLLANSESDLDKSLQDEFFWPQQVALYKPILKGIDLDDKTIKKLLKVGLYTSLNGGTPSSEARLIANLGLNAENYLLTHNLTTTEALTKSELFTQTRELMNSFQLIREVKALSSQCATKNFDTNNYEVYTVDRLQPYIVDSAHKGISRVLQGFEVVLLSVLVFQIIQRGFKVISLDHDGVLIMISRKQFKALEESPSKIADSLSEDLFANFSSYLLDQAVPIETKRLIYQGEALEL